MTRDSRNEDFNEFLRTLRDIMVIDLHVYRNRWCATKWTCLITAVSLAFLAPLLPIPVWQLCLIQTPVAVLAAVADHYEEPPPQEVPC